MRVAIVGVGNCASTLVQGVQYYRGVKAEETVPGLMHVDFGGYHIRDIEFTGAFDVSGYMDFYNMLERSRLESVNRDLALRLCNGHARNAGGHRQEVLIPRR